MQGGGENGANLNSFFGMWKRKLTYTVKPT